MEEEKSKTEEKVWTGFTIFTGEYGELKTIHHTVAASEFNKKYKCIVTGNPDGFHFQKNQTLSRKSPINVTK